MRRRQVARQPQGSTAGSQCICLHFHQYSTPVMGLQPKTHRDTRAAPDSHELSETPSMPSGRCLKPLAARRCITRSRCPACSRPHLHLLAVNTASLSPGPRAAPGKRLECGSRPPFCCSHWRVSGWVYLGRDNCCAPARQRRAVGARRRRGAGAAHARCAAPCPACSQAHSWRDVTMLDAPRVMRRSWFGRCRLLRP